jgi:mannose-6-phosphate isomerase-like protein (cupin superfamily)
MSVGRLPVYNIKDIPKETRLHQGRMTRYSIRTKHAQLVFAEIQPQPLGQQTYHRLPHDHPYDMMLIVVKGAMHMEIGGHVYELHEGSAMVIPAYVMHRGYAMGDKPASLIEVFAPARADYIHLVEYQKEDFGDKGEAWVKPDHDSWNAPKA